MVSIQEQFVIKSRLQWRKEITEDLQKKFSWVLNQICFWDKNSQDLVSKMSEIIQKFIMHTKLPPKLQ